MLAYMALSMGNGMQQRKPIDRELMMAVSLDFLRNNVGLQDGGRTGSGRLPRADPPAPRRADQAPGLIPSVRPTPSATTL